jgi:hypothetical protein
VSDPAAPILAGYLDGSLTADSAADQLYALLTSGTDLSLGMAPRLVPLFEALHERLAPGTPFELPPAPPVVWDPKAWGDLSRTAEDLWPLVEGASERQVPVCLEYSLRLGSETALEQVQSWIGSHTDHSCEVERPPSFRHFHAILWARTRPRVLDREDVVEWARGLAAMPVFADATPESLGISRQA